MPLDLFPRLQRLQAELNDLREACRHFTHGHPEGCLCRGCRLVRNWITEKRREGE